MDKNTRKNIVGQNIFLCKYGSLKSLSFSKSIKNFHEPNFNINMTTNFADVYVKSMHTIEMAREFLKHNLNPVIVTTVTKDFDGTNIENSTGMTDPLINVRTTFHSTLTANSLYPLKGSEVIYNKMLHVIRDNIMNINDFVTVSLIVASSKNIPKKQKTLKYTEYLELREIIETVFQTAISGGNDVLILDDFGCKTTGIPENDIIDIFNIMILKYGYCFKFIVIAINLTDQTDFKKYALFDKEIIKPQNIGNEVVQ